jgi:5'-deoxynucleotidase YfbR-like HD superfamily hydrolase
MTLLNTLTRLLPLDDLPRTGWILRGVPDPESIAGHILGTAHLALALAPREDPPLDLGRVLGMVLVHDLPEAASGDLPRGLLPAEIKHAIEHGLATKLITPLGSAAAEAWAEFQAGETREARFARLCDRLQLGVRLVGYLRAGRRGLDEFRGGLEALDTAEFPAAAGLRSEILAELTGADG